MKSRKPVFSLTQATARLPDGWQAAARAWLERADNPMHVEHILCVDECDIPKLPLTERTLTDRLVINKGRRCCTDAYNRAGAAARGDVMIVVADDFFPCEHWDTLLVNVIPDVKAEHVVWVPTGSNDGLMTHPIFTRAYYERYGRIFFPEYESMFSDNDFQAQAEKDGVLIDCRKTLPEFPHKHPGVNRAPWDEVYERQNRAEAYALGRAVFEQRKAAGFVS